METKKEIMLGTLILSVFLFILSFSSLYVQTQISRGNACGCLIPLPLFIPFLGSLGLFIGVSIYSLLFPHEKGSKISKDSLLKLFKKDERKVIGILLSNSGEYLQSEIVNETDLSKVKVHRVLKRLESKGIIRKESLGNSNRVIARDFLKRLSN